MIPWKNSQVRWGLVAISLHWLMAPIVIGMFVLGLYMTSLTYYDPWYRTAPALHKSIGFVLFGLLLLRLLWRWFNPTPASLPSHTALEQFAAKAMHVLLYLLLIFVMISGYLISTADGRPVEVFGLLQIPALISSIERQEDIAGVIHLSLAITTMVMAGLHALAALKHHIVDRDRTLLRMVGR